MWLEATDPLTPPSEPCCAYNAQSRRFEYPPAAPHRLRSGTSLKYRPLRPVSHNNLLSPPRRYHHRLIYLLLDASSSGCAQLVVSSGRQTLHRQLKALMSWATFGASNPEEYRLREDFLTYCLLLLDSQPANAPPQLSDLSPIVSFLGKAQPPEGKVILAFSLKKYHLSPTRTTTVEVT